MTRIRMKCSNRQDGSYMKNEYRIIPETPYPLGCLQQGNDLHFSAVYHGGRECGICLYKRKTSRRQLILFDEQYRSGSIYSVQISDAAADFDSYMIYEDGVLRCDPYAQRIYGLEKWGRAVPEEELRCGFGTEPLRPLHRRMHIPYEKSFLYCLHVRGYSKSPSSGIPESLRGTFRGLEEKITYLKSLGVTAAELMPVYEMQSAELPRRAGLPDDKASAGTPAVSEKDAATYLISENGSIRSSETQKKKINFWGYTGGYYFTPRAAFCADPQNPDTEFLHMVHAFHDAGMEVILQFYFPEEITPQYILDVLRFWVSRYEIDGIHLKGAQIPDQMIAQDPLLSEIKIMDYGFDYDRIYGRNRSTPPFRTLAEYRDDFLYIARRFLKGDDNTLNTFLNAMHLNAADHGTINYVCNYDGLRLADLVSYEHKHNEQNGESNNDGLDDNCSWNCGVEGPSRKRSVCQLRSRQIRNILTMLFLSQGTPMLFGGDEFGNSQNGNNNPYCQDNATGWIDWNAVKQHEELLSYVRFLSDLRSSYPLFHQTKPFRLMDYKACGYPDFSYHGMEAWRPDLSNYSHSIGMLYCGFYTQETEDHSFFYIAYNMHWKPVTFALPRLPEGMKWYLLSDTAAANQEEKPLLLQHQGQVFCDARTVCIYIGKGSCKMPALEKRQSF